MNRTLDTLLLDENGLGPLGLQLIRTGLSRNRTLHHLPTPLNDLSYLMKERATTVEPIWCAIQEVS